MKILNSQTRVRIIKALKERNKTLSELSRELEFSKSTVFKHLMILQSEGIVKKVVNGNKFVYYKLSEKGREIVEVLTSLALSLAAATITYLKFAKEVEHAEHVTPTYTPSSLPTPKPAGGLLPDFIVSETSHTSPVAAAILTFIFLFVIILFSLRLFRPKSC